MEKILFLGCGSWGGALGVALANKGYSVTMWHRNNTLVKSMEESRNHYLVPSLSFPKNVSFKSDINTAIQDASIIIIAIPSQSVRKLLEKHKKYFSQYQMIVNVSKGIEIGTLMTLSQVFSDVFGKSFNRIVTLSGPSHAEEVIQGSPTTLVSASNNKKAAELIQKLFYSKIIRTYVNSDIKGVELGGSIKNVIAIASGIIDGVGYGDNTKAALLTRGLYEISKLGVAMGGNLKTFSGLSGMGDLIVTCYSKYSRNRYVGEELGRGKDLKTILAGMSMIAEGIHTTESVHKLSKNYSIDMPITQAVYDVLFNKKEPKIAVQELMRRDLIEE